MKRNTGVIRFMDNEKGQNKRVQLPYLEINHDLFWKIWFSNKWSVLQLLQFLRHSLQSVVLKITHHRHIPINGDSRRLTRDRDGTWVMMELSFQGGKWAFLPIDLWFCIGMWLIRRLRPCKFNLLREICKKSFFPNLNMACCE